MKVFGNLIKRASIANTENDIDYIHGIVQANQFDIEYVLNALDEYATLDFSKKLLFKILKADYQYDKEILYQSIIDDFKENERDTGFTCEILKHLDNLPLNKHHDFFIKNYDFFIVFDRTFNHSEKTSICSYLLNYKAKELISNLFEPLSEYDESSHSYSRYSFYNSDKYILEYFIDNIERFDDIIIKHHENIIEFLIDKQSIEGEQPEDNIILRSIKYNSEYITIEKPEHKAFLEEKIYKMELLNF